MKNRSQEEQNYHGSLNQILFIHEDQISLFQSLNSFFNAILSLTISI